ncbi:uncharacterized protein [Montipora capricornis]|uniref:uncharacterized protein n=1 Tax=Montipora capricornis TaxID=246305 RepID=UPI0035F1A34C
MTLHVMNVGTDESNARCTKCPPGHYSNVARASNCTPCSYFEYQSKKGQQQCDICPPDTYAMLGASKCLPLPNCTDDDLIEVPGNLDTCSCFSNNTCTTTLQPTYVKVKGFKTGLGFSATTRIIPSLKRNRFSVAVSLDIR